MGFGDSRLREISVRISVPFVLQLTCPVEEVWLGFDLELGFGFGFGFGFGL